MDRPPQFYQQFVRIEDETGRIASFDELPDSTVIVTNDGPARDSVVWVKREDARTVLEKVQSDTDGKLVFEDEALDLDGPLPWEEGKEVSVEK